MTSPGHVPGHAPRHDAYPAQGNAPVRPVQAGLGVPPFASSAGVSAGYPYPLYYAHYGPPVQAVPYAGQVPVQGPVVQGPVQGPAQAGVPPVPVAPGAGAPLGYPYPVPYPPGQAGPNLPGSSAPGTPAGTPRRRQGVISRMASWQSGAFLLCLLAGFFTLGSIMGHEEVLTGTPIEEIPLPRMWVALVVVLIAFFFRHRWPVVPAALSSLAGLVTSLDTTVGLVAMTTVVRRARSVRDPVPWVVGILLGAGTWRAVSRDIGQAPTGNSVVGLFLFAEEDGVGVVPWEVVPVLSLLLVALPVATGLWLRARDGERAAREHAQEAAAASAQAERTAKEQAMVSTHLAERVDLQEERERVAREVHDGLGHRLSLLALHAAALEAAAEQGGEQEGGDQEGGALEAVAERGGDQEGGDLEGGDVEPGPAGGLEGGSGSGGGPQDAASPPRGAGPGRDEPTNYTREAARLVREEAETAMRDLRSLLAVLREPVGAVDPAPRLADLADMVDDVLAAQQPISSSIFLDRADQADDVLSRAVYRIVQESLTNARKHAPGRTVRLRVEGGPTTGVDITCSNPVDAEPDSAGTVGPAGLAGTAGSAGAGGGDALEGVPGASAARTAAASVSAPDGATPGPDQAGATSGGAGFGAGRGASAAGSGTGLRGMAKRAEICGGTFQAGPDGHGRFVVRSHLPWRPAEAPSPDGR